MFGGQRHAPVNALRSVLPKTSTISRAWRSLSSFRRRLRAIKEQNSTSLKVLITGALICRSASSAVGLGDYDKAGADGRRRTRVTGSSGCAVRRRLTAQCRNNSNLLLPRPIASFVIASEVRPYAIVRCSPPGSGYSPLPWVGWVGSATRICKARRRALPIA